MESSPESQDISNSSKNKWTTLKPLKGKWSRWNPVCIGTSIWISTDYNDGESGMVEYCCNTDSYLQIVTYPDDIKPECHSVCGTEDNKIVIIDGGHGNITVFDPETKTFDQNVIMPTTMGDDTVSLVVNGYVHILNGTETGEDQCCIYSLKDRIVDYRDSEEETDVPIYVSFTCGTPKDRKHQRSQAVSVCEYWMRLYLSNNNICGHGDVLDLVVTFYFIESAFYKFGGYAYGKTSRDCKYINDFNVGTLYDNDPTQPIQWKLEPKYTLKKPLCQCAAIQYGPYIVTFGGKTAEGLQILDDIYILDVRSEKGWIQSELKCPKKSPYVGVLDHEMRVHLFSFGQRGPCHFSIALRDVVPEIESL